MSSNQKPRSNNKKQDQKIEADAHSKAMKHFHPLPPKRWFLKTINAQKLITYPGSQMTDLIQLVDEGH